MRFLKLTLAYDGSNYVGWQVQPNGPSIQAEIEKAIAAVCGQMVRVTASGRTDAGVHALGQVASFQIDTRLEAEAVRRAINANTPIDICVYEIEEVSASFHPIADAKRKTYRYVIQDGPFLDVIQRAYSWHIQAILDVESMRQGAEFLVGEHDFESFQATGSDRQSTIRTIYSLSIAEMESNGRHQIIIEVEGNGFLYNMVRNIVGSLVEIGRKRRQPAWLGQVLQGCDRGLAGMTAPARGLFLVRVDY